MASLTFPFGEKLKTLATSSTVKMSFNKNKKQLTIVTETTVDLSTKTHSLQETAGVPTETGLVNFALDTQLRDDLPDVQIVAQDNKKFFLLQTVKINGDKRDHSA